MCKLINNATEHLSAKKIRQFMCQEKFLKKKKKRGGYLPHCLGDQQKMKIRNTTSKIPLAN